MIPVHEPIEISSCLDFFANIFLYGFLPIVFLSFIILYFLVSFDVFKHPDLKQIKDSHPISIFLVALFWPTFLLPRSIISRLAKIL